MLQPGMFLPILIIARNVSVPVALLSSLTQAKFGQMATMDSVVIHTPLLRLAIMRQEANTGLEK